MVLLLKSAGYPKWFDELVDLSGLAICSGDFSSYYDNRFRQGASRNDGAGIARPLRLQPIRRLTVSRLAMPTTPPRSRARPGGALCLVGRTTRATVQHVVDISATMLLEIVVA